MIDKKLVVMDEELSERFKPKTEKFVRVAPEVFDEEILQELMDNLSKRAYKQLELLMNYIAIAGMQHNEPVWVPQSELLKQSSPSALKSLIDKGIFQSEKREVSRLKSGNISEKLPDQISLSAAQKEAYRLVKENILVAM